MYQTQAWKAVRLYVLDRDGWQCQVKGKRCIGSASEADHVVPLADGGAMYDPHNLRAACKPCNGERAARRTNAIRRMRGRLPTYDVRL